jgi:thiol-disulfide isomerase/thioredoxin
VTRLLAAALLCCLAVAARAEGIEPLFAATLDDLADKPVAVAQYKGRPLIVNFWARWCGPCRDEIPDFIKARAKHKAKGVEVLGIAIEDNTEGVREFAKAYEIDYPVLMAKNKGIALMHALGNTRAGLPYTLVINRQGRLVSSKLGPMKTADIDAAFEAAIK